MNLFERSGGGGGALQQLGHNTLGTTEAERSEKPLEMWREGAVGLTASPEWVKVASEPIHSTGPKQVVGQAFMPCSTPM